jgi:FHS family L-fucose permease-like MFS transporter
LTALMGAVSDASAVNYAILVPTFCFMVIGWFAWSASRLPATDLQAVTMTA